LKGASLHESLLAKAKAMRTLLWFAALVLWMVIFVPKQLTSFFKPEAVKKNAPVTEQVNETTIANGIHLESGLIVDLGYESVLRHCGGCHSFKLVTQNSATKAGWKSTIDWMQATQNLWSLGSEEEVILEYLAKNYAPKAQGRRKQLENMEWYVLE
jgi:hypothetical protein